MSCTDPIADLLTVIRNGLAAGKKSITVPHSKMKMGVLKVLKDEGYIGVFEALETKPARTIKVALKYGPAGEQVITEIHKVSTAGRREYAGRRDLKPIIRGFGISIISTSRGIISDRVARQQKLGGEVLCIVK
ncbi:MAG: 30S ribosomal protein S8 [Planctomycetes bacterium]|jgi:small subunit ribosomal protein S8|nr:30S ribosomal protein S8 [Planctomycetota bacterium]